MGLFILVKKGKKLLGVIPAKKKATTSQLKKLIKTQLSKGFSARIINGSQLKRILKKMLPIKAKRLIRKSKLVSKRKRKSHKIKRRKYGRRKN